MGAAPLLRCALRRTMLYVDRLTSLADRGIINYTKHILMYVFCTKNRGGERNG